MQRTIQHCQRLKGEEDEAKVIPHANKQTAREERTTQEKGGWVMAVLKLERESLV